MMKKIGVFPGSFDPFTKGHEDIVRRAIPLFDELIIGVGVNQNKTYLFETESRVTHIKSLFEKDSSVQVEAYDGLTVDFCSAKKAGYLIRGLRNTRDFEFEEAIGQMNRDLKGIETVFLMTDKMYGAVSSTIVREIKINGGDITQFVTNHQSLIINKR
jgi:pantetheine-phosphate adenylyltransferase